MDIRELRPADASHLQTIARESFETSYPAFSKDAIEAVIDRWYSDEAIEAIFADDQAILVGVDHHEDEESDPHLVAFGQGSLTQDETVVGDIHWLHVSPGTRRSGIGSQLLGDLVDRMDKRGAVVVRGWLLATNNDGATFFEHHGFEPADSRRITIDDQPLEERRYDRHLGETTSDIVDTVSGPDGQNLYVNYAAGETGTLAPFYPAYLDEELDEQFSWLCRNCESTRASMDTAGRIRCEDCDNTRKATRWDGAYL